MVPRTSVWKSTYALVVISPAITTRPVQVRVSQATRLVESSCRQASRMASEIWSAILSGWPSVTDSEVNRKRFFAGKLVSPQGDFEPLLLIGGLITPQALNRGLFRSILKTVPEMARQRNEIGRAGGAEH